KCSECGLVNTAADEICRRCGAPVTSAETPQQITEPVSEPEDQPKKRGFLKRLTWILGATLIALIAWYISLVLTSDALQPEQKQKVESAIAILQQQGFAREAFVLKYLTTFRSSDN